MMIADAFNSHVYPSKTEITATKQIPIFLVCSTGEEESKCIIVHETLSQSCSANEDESKQSIVNETLLQNYSADVDELCSTEEDKS